MKVKFVKYNENARIPKKAHPSDFCFDVWAVSEREVAPNVWQYGLGFGLQIERGTEVCEQGSAIYEKYGAAYGREPDKTIDFSESNITLSIDFRPRSSIYKTGMVLANSEPTIDENYTGEIFLNFYHVIPSLERYHVGDKIGQCKLGMAFPMEFIEVEKLEDTDRGDNGLGSSGK